MIKYDEIIKQIKERLNTKRLIDLPFQEICIYTSYRIKNLLKNTTTLSTYEIQYNLCEVGPGLRRLDPLTLDIILNSKYFKQIKELKTIKHNNIIFYAANDLPNSAMGIKVKEKATIINHIYSAESGNILHIIQTLIKETAERQGYKVINSNIRSTYVECEVSHNKIIDLNLSIRYYNNREWFYPDNNEIWELYKHSAKIDSIPIMLAPYFHGTCFQLFKSIGIFARSTYINLIDTNNYSLIQNIKIGRFVPIEQMADSKELIELSYLLTVTIPQLYLSFGKHLKQSYIKILPILENKLNDMTNSHHNNYIQQIKFIERMIKLFRLVGINEIRRFAKRSRNWIDQ